MERRNTPSSGLATRNEPETGLAWPDPFSEMRRFRGVFDNMFDTLFDFGPRQAWSPAMNLYRDGGELVAELALPGVRKEDVEVRLEGETLTISGHAKSEKEVREEHMFRREMFSGRFSRSIRLPQGVQAEQIKAECKDGVLKVHMPMAEESAQARRIDIQ